MDVSIKQASRIDQDLTHDIADVLMQGIGEQFEFYSKKPEKLVEAFASGVDPEKFYVAMEKPNQILGIMAVSDGKNRAFKFNKKDLREALGFYKGGVAYYAFTTEFETPVDLTSNALLIELVATRASARKRGIATKLLEYAFAELPADEFHLIVGSAKTDAIALYEKLGFNEYRREKDPNAHMSGSEENIYMRKMVD